MPGHLNELVTTKAGSLRFQQALTWCFQELSPAAAGRGGQGPVDGAAQRQQVAAPGTRSSALGEAQYTSALLSLRDRLRGRGYELQGILQNTHRGPVAALGLDSLKQNAKDLWAKAKARGQTAGEGSRPCPGTAS
ncbi:MAG: hypothetical protein R3F30_05960 [Planctomycetota bacterium]